MLKYTLLIIAFILIAAAAVVRVKPLDPADLHLDPETAQKPSVRGHILVREGEEIEPPVFNASREMLAEKLESIILAAPRTSKLSGELSETYATYVTRSKLWGFPDIASVKIVEENGKSRVLVLSRLRYGEADFGVNKARVIDWLSQLQDAMQP